MGILANLRLFFSKTALIIFFVATCTTVTLNICPFQLFASTDTDNDTPSSQVVYIRLGTSASFSGGRRAPSTNGLYGMLAMIDWINDDSNPGITGRNVRVKFDLEMHDDKSSNDDVERIYSDLTRGKTMIDVLIGPYGSSATDIASKIAEQKNVLFLGPFGASDSIYETPSSWLIQITPPASKYYTGQVAMLAGIAATEGKTLQTALSFEDDEFSISVHDATKAMVDADPHFNTFFDGFYPDEGGDLLTPGGDMDLYIDGLLESINSNTNEGEDVVIIGGGHDPDGIAFAQLLASKNYRPESLALLVAPGIPSYFCEVAMDAEGCTSSYAEGITSAMAWYPPLETFVEGVTNVAVNLDWYGPSHDVSIELIKAKNGGEEPSYHAGLGGQAILALAKSISDTNSLSKAKVRDALRTLQFQSCFGNYGVNVLTGKQELQDMLVVQWQVIDGTPGLQVVWPEAQANNTFVYPMP